MTKVFFSSSACSLFSPPPHPFLPRHLKADYDVPHEPPKPRLQCGSARRKLREEREGASTQSSSLGEERRVYQPPGAGPSSSTTTRASTSTKNVGRGGSHGGGLARDPEVSLRSLHRAKEEEASWQLRDEARWVEAEQLVSALKQSKEEPQPKPLPPLHAKGASEGVSIPHICRAFCFRFFLLFACVLRQCVLRQCLVVKTGLFLTARSFFLTRRSSRQVNLRAAFDELLGERV